jgi:hypothetical protein
MDWVGELNARPQPAVSKRTVATEEEEEEQLYCSNSIRCTQFLFVFEVAYAIFKTLKQ